MRSIVAIASLLIKEIFRKKDFYVSLILTVFILLYASRFQFYKVDNAFRYLLDIGMGLAALFAVILTVSLAARQFPSEVQNRTCHVLLSKPLSRGQFIVGKCLGSFIAGCACFLVFFGILAAFALAKSSELSWLVAGQTFYLFCLNLLVLTALSTAFSIFLTTSANVSLSLLIYLLISLYGFGLKKFVASSLPVSRVIGEVIYYAVPHFEFFDMRQRFIHGWDAIPASLVAFLTFYALMYSAFFLLLAFLLLRKKPIL